MLDSFGSIRVRAYTAGGALPVPNAVVRIKGAEEDNRFFVKSLLTDRDGMTEKINIPAPDIDFSLIPSPSEAPYAVYDIEVSAPGYYNKNIVGVSVFSGIESVQLMNMIPRDTNAADDYPIGNIDATIPENYK